MKTFDLETIAYIFGYAAEAMFMMAALEKAASIKPSKKAKPTSEKMCKNGGRPKGAKNWTQAETDTVLKMHNDLHNIPDISMAVGRNDRSVRSKLGKLLRAGAA